MAIIQLPETLAQQLESIAKQQNRSVADLLQSFVEQFPNPETNDDLPPNAMIRLAKTAQNMTFAALHTDVAQNSRAILETEYADYLAKRMKRPKRGENENGID